MRATWVLVPIALILGLPVAAQESSPSRREPPSPGPAPSVPVLHYQSYELPNGIRLAVARRPGVPLVSVRVGLLGGATTFDPPSAPGAIALLAGVLGHGSRAHAGPDFTEAMQRLGTRISVNFAQESGTIAFTALTESFQPALSLVAEMMLEPAFDSAAFELQRRQTIQMVTGWQGQLNPLATGVFLTAAYGEGHPYAAGLREVEPLRRLTLEDLRRVHVAYLRPGRTIITVAGDIDPETVRRQVEDAFGGWVADGGRPTFQYPPPPSRDGASIHLVDRPGASQVQFIVGLPAIASHSADVIPALVLQQILGQGLQSRLSRNLREQRGFTYGIFAGFQFGEGPGPFRIVTAVNRSKADSALTEIFRELRGIAGEIPITDDELREAKQVVVLSLVGSFETVSATANALRTAVLRGGGHWWAERARQVEQVTKEDVVRIAQTYLRPDQMVVAVAGDRATVEEPLRRLRLGPITIHDVEGKRIR